MSAVRESSYGQDYSPSAVDRFGVWLSTLQVRRFVPDFRGKRVADLGCGFNAAFTRTILDQVESATLVDVALAEDLRAHPRVRAFQGGLPDALGALPDASFDVVMLISVLEHLWEPLRTLQEMRRLVRPEGVCLVNVPSWRGKHYLELSAFKLGFSAACEMDDHKMYYDVKDLWPLLVKAGFPPSGIRCFTHKIGLNTFAVCRAPVAKSGAG